MYQNYLLNKQTNTPFLDPAPISNSVHLGWDINVFILSKFQVILILLLRGPYFGNHIYSLRHGPETVPCGSSV